MEYFKIKTRKHGYMDTKHNQVTDNESGLYYMILPRTAFGAQISDQAIKNLWTSLGGDIYRYRCSHEHDCCACYYQDALWIQRSGSRIIARQSFGINI